MHSYKPLKPTPGVLADSAGLEARKARGLSALRRSIERHAKPSESDWQAMESILRPLVLSSGGYFARQGERPQRLGFIISGLVRVFYSTPEGEERIIIFREEGIGSILAIVGGIAALPVCLLQAEYVDHKGSHRFLMFTICAASICLDSSTVKPSSMRARTVSFSSGNLYPS